MEAPPKSNGERDILQPGPVRPRNTDAGGHPHQTVGVERGALQLRGRVLPSLAIASLDHALANLVSLVAAS
jgi:hypothetical protein